MGDGLRKVGEFSAGRPHSHQHPERGAEDTRQPMALRRTIPTGVAFARALACRGGACVAVGGSAPAGTGVLSALARSSAPDAALRSRTFASTTTTTPNTTTPRFLVTGAGGQIGVELCRELVAEHGPDAVVATDARPRAGLVALDVTDAQAVDDGEFFVSKDGRLC